MLPQRIRYARALSVCLSDTRPAGIKPWGGADFFEGKYALHLLYNKERPIYIHYWVGGAIPEWPYTDKSYRPDVFLAKSQFEADLAVKEYELDAAQVEVVGQARFENLPLFAVNYSTDVSRRLLNLPLGRKLYLGVDPSGVLPGYQSYREQLELVTAVLDAARNQTGLIVAIKPHPSYGIDHLLPLIASHRCKNVVVLPKRSPVNHFLNAIDIIVTKYSTLVLEAALMGRYSISAILDGDERFKVFGDLPEIVTTGNELGKIIIKLSSDKMFFESWKATQRDRQEKILPRFYSDGKSPASSAAEKVIEKLRGYRDKH